MTFAKTGVITRTRHEDHACATLLEAIRLFCSASLLFKSLDELRKQSTALDIGPLSTLGRR